MNKTTPLFWRTVPTKVLVAVRNGFERYVDSVITDQPDARYLPQLSFFLDRKHLIDQILVERNVDVSKHQSAKAESVQHINNLTAKPITKRY